MLFQCVLYNLPEKVKIRVMIPILDFVAIQIIHGTFSLGLLLSRQKKVPEISLTFVDEIAANMSNKCTLINPNTP